MQPLIKIFSMEKLDFEKDAYNDNRHFVLVSKVTYLGSILDLESHWVSIDAK